jgi:hypothetical protein
MHLHHLGLVRAEDGLAEWTCISMVSSALATPLQLWLLVVMFNLLAPH